MCRSIDQSYVVKSRIIGRNHGDSISTQPDREHQNLRKLPRLNCPGPAGAGSREKLSLKTQPYWGAHNELSRSGGKQGNYQKKSSSGKLIQQDQNGQRGRKDARVNFVVGNESLRTLGLSRSSISILFAWPHCPCPPIKIDHIQSISDQILPCTSCRSVVTCFSTSQNDSFHQQWLDSATEDRCSRGHNHLNSRFPENVSTPTCTIYRDKNAATCSYPDCRLGP
ncbi:hypothetical protein NPIL_437701 [Nephila pilipes]|uniref:Uncharacterized protein n=1 Tax=Nephila pilipes TaxID=299642 RepID=A0A8X6NZX7_NEPPI|nr:hypothetical protein NPIL_437701 [Nephila pilipes]